MWPTGQSPRHIKPAPLLCFWPLFARVCKHTFSLMEQRRSAGNGSLKGGRLFTSGGEQQDMSEHEPTAPMKRVKFSSTQCDIWSIHILSIQDFSKRQCVFIVSYSVGESRRDTNRRRLPPLSNIEYCFCHTHQDEVKTVTSLKGLTFGSWLHVETDTDGLQESMMTTWSWIMIGVWTCVCTCV